jgi:transcriptional regulator with XRE-family HTH domain
VPVKTIEVKVGERVRALREERGLLQRQLATAAGLPARTVGRLERGEADARLSTLAKIASALKVDVKDLFP